MPTAVNNVVNLSRRHKPVGVYVAPTKQFLTIKTLDDLKGLLALGDSDSVSGSSTSCIWVFCSTVLPANRVRSAVSHRDRQADRSSDAEPPPLGR
jgi:hypothetical protein